MKHSGGELTYAISLEGVGKRYWKLEEQAMLLRSILPFGRTTRTELWSLRGIDLQVAPGETVGVLGRNGAGKTTMLRLIAGVSGPSEGRVRVAGRIAPLISVGVGFHQEMSGRENVYVNGMLLGLTRAEIDDRFDDILAFAELEEFIDTPVKFYSSGMFMRLGFSVAIHSDPDVFLLDEVLAVGDMAFQLKCFEKMREIQRSGASLLVVSHSIHAIRLLCPRAILLRKGELLFDGDTEQGVALYHEQLSADIDTREGRRTGSAFVGGVTIVSKELIGREGLAHHADPNVPLRLVLRVRFDRDVDSPVVTLSVFAEDGSVAYQIMSEVGRRYRTYRAGEVAEIDITFLPRLAGGTYRLSTTITNNDLRQTLLREHAGTLVYVAARPGTTGTAELDAAISIDGSPMNFPDEMLLGDANQPLRD